MSGFNPHWIVGKTIASVSMNPEPAREGKKCPVTMHSPVIHFTDGSRITFTTEESDWGRYGTDINYYGKNQ